MKVLVLGGTGAIGTHVVRQLADDGHSVVVTSRSDRRGENNISYRQGNARDIDFVKGLLQERWDAIVDFMVYTTEEFEERAELILSSTKQYLFLSSARVFANSETPITEKSNRLLDVSDDAEFLSTNEYSLDKARQENILQNSGTNWTIIRPYITYDAYRLQLGVLEKEDWLYRAMKGRSIVVSKEVLSHLTTLTYGNDVAEGIVALVGKEGAFSKSFNITTNRCVLWRDVLEKYTAVMGRVLGRPIKVVETDCDLGIRYGSKYQLIYDRFYDRRFDNASIVEYMPNKQFVEWEKGLEDSLVAFVKAPNFRTINWTIEARRDRVANEFTPLREICGIKNKLKYLICRFTNK